MCARSVLNVTVTRTKIYEFLIFRSGIIFLHLFTMFTRLCQDTICNVNLYEKRAWKRQDRVFLIE